MGYGYAAPMVLESAPACDQAKLVGALVLFAALRLGDFALIF